MNRLIALFPLKFVGMVAVGPRLYNVRLAVRWVPDWASYLRRSWRVRRFWASRQVNGQQTVVQVLDLALEWRIEGD